MNQVLTSQKHTGQYSSSWKHDQPKYLLLMYCIAHVSLYDLKYVHYTALKPVYIQYFTVSIEIPKKVFGRFDNVFHVYLMRGFQKYARNWILTMAFWATCKIAQPIQPIWQLIFALP